MMKNIRSKKPTRMWIDGKCFIINHVKPKLNKKDLKEKEETASEEAVDEDVLSEEIDITTNEDGNLSTSFHLPNLYYKKLTSFPHFDLRALKNETETDIYIPKVGEKGNLIVSGKNEVNIKNALKELHMVISQIRQQNVALQFISIPLLSNEIKDNFEKFKSDVLKLEGVRGMDESIFQKPLKLHLTIIVFSLLNDREINEAINVLQSYKDSLSELVQKHGPLKIKVSGLECMNNDYKNVHVLYANADIIHEDPEVNLQKIANNISDYFYEKGLLKSYNESVKLHMTLINSKYRKTKQDKSPKKHWSKRQVFDATQIMEKYKDYEFGECDFDTINLSLISTTDENGFYKSISTIKI